MTAAFCSECLLKTSSLAGPRSVGAADAPSEIDTDGCNPCDGGAGDPLRWAAAVSALWMDQVGVRGWAGDGGHVLPACKVAGTLVVGSSKWTNSVGSQS